MIFHLLLNYPNTYHRQNWADPTLGARSIFGVSHVSAGTQTLVLSQAIIRELDGKLNIWDMNQSPRGMPVPAD